MKTLSIQRTVTPPDWSPNRTSEDFNNWQRYIHGLKSKMKSRRKNKPRWELNQFKTT